MSAPLEASSRGGKLSVLWHLRSDLAKTSDIYGEMKVRYGHNMCEPEESRGMGCAVATIQLNVSDYGLWDRRIRAQFLTREREFCPPESRLVRTWRPPTLLPNGYWRLGEYISRGVKPTTHLQLVPRLIMAGAIPTLPPTSLWRAALNTPITLLCIHQLLKLRITAVGSTHSDRNG
jgi:hypothetical protein